MEYRRQPVASSGSVATKEGNYIFPSKRLHTPKDSRSISITMFFIWLSLLSINSNQPGGLYLFQILETKLADHIYIHIYISWPPPQIAQRASSTLLFAASPSSRTCCNPLPILPRRTWSRRSSVAASSSIRRLQLVVELASRDSPRSFSGRLPVTVRTLVVAIAASMDHGIDVSPPCPSRWRWHRLISSWAEPWHRRRRTVVRHTPDAIGGNQNHLKPPCAAGDCRLRITGAPHIWEVQASCRLRHGSMFGAVPGARRWRACILGSKRPWINQISHGPTREQPIGWSCCCVEQKRFDKQSHCQSPRRALVKLHACGRLASVKQGPFVGAGESEAECPKVAEWKIKLMLL